MIGTDENYATSSLFPYLHFANHYTGSVTPGADATMSFNTSAVTLQALMLKVTTQHLHRGSYPTAE